jgi:Kef-type K+ transport system membrane component KefB
MSPVVPTAAARTVALTTLVVNGLYLVMALEAGGSRRRSTIVAAMCTAMAGIYAVAIVVPTLRSFFALSTPSAAMIGTALLASAITIAAMALSGYSLRVAPPGPAPADGA